MPVRVLLPELSGWVNKMRTGNAFSAEEGELLIGEFELVGLQGVEDGFGTMCARNDEHVIALGQFPSQHHTLIAHAMLGSHLAERVEQVLVVRVAIAAERAPAHEGEALLRAVFQRILVSR